MNNQAPFLDDVLGVVLCGGQATRMGGSDKGLIDFRGRPMVSYALDALRVCHTTVINANRNHQAYRDIFDAPIVSDENANFDGPLSGMLSALRYAHQNHLSWVISIPCDAPFVDAEYCKRMYVAQQASDKKILMASDGFRQPVFSMLHTSVIPKLELFLHDEQKKIVLFYESVGYDVVNFPNSHYFTNINTPADRLITQ